MLFVWLLVLQPCTCLTANEILENSGERLGRGIVTDAITTPIVNTSAYFFKKTSELIDFKVSLVASNRLLNRFKPLMFLFLFCQLPIGGAVFEF